MVLPDLDVDSAEPDRALIFLGDEEELPLGGEPGVVRLGGRRRRRRLRVGRDFLDLLREGRDDGVAGGGAGVGGGLGPPGGEPEEGGEEEEEDEGGADADADDDPHVEAEDDGALRELVVEHRGAVAAAGHCCRQRSSGLRKKYVLKMSSLKEYGDVWLPNSTRRKALQLRLDLWNNGVLKM